MREDQINEFNDVFKLFVTQGQKSKHFKIDPPKIDQKNRLFSAIYLNITQTGFFVDKYPEIKCAKTK